MPIQFNEATKVFTLETDHSAYQMQIGPYGFLFHLHYGEKLAGGEAGYLYRYRTERAFCGNPNDAGTDRSFSVNVLPQEYSTFGLDDYRVGCLHVENSDGSQLADLRYRSHRILPGLPVLEGLPALHGEGETLEITLSDAVSGLEVRLLYGVAAQYDCIARSAVAVNRGTKPVVLCKALSCCLDFYGNDYDLLTFYGKHLGERSLERTPVRHGKITADSLRGASSHQQNPFVILCGSDATEQAGECWGASLLYSGNFEAVAEVDQLDNTRLALGIHHEGFRWTLEPEASFYMPQTALCYSGAGIEHLSQLYHKLFRERLCRGKFAHARRPVLVNSWEAAYFDFTAADLVRLAKAAAPLGVELLVMDDGWFGKRDDDNTGLGDWIVNEKKLGCTLAELADRVNDTGMQLGIWIEPEMVNEDSNLYRAHPEWALAAPGRPPRRNRNQLVLDMSRRDVRDALFDALYHVLTSAKIAYVKWDMNRHMSDVWSALLPAAQQGEVYHRYILGVYELMDRLTAALPDVLFEGCSGGGGRFDAGMLYYMPQIWCSDNTDALERIRIQYGTSFGYPVSAMGAHVSASPNHQTGRETPLQTRGVVAMAGTFGYELDISKLSDSEKDTIRDQTAAYKAFYSLINEGVYFRLTDVCKNTRFAAWEFAAPDGSQALLNYVQIRAEGNPRINRVKLRGLCPDAVYRLSNQDAAGVSETYTGAALMYAGFVFPILSGDLKALQYHFIRCK